MPRRGFYGNNPGIPASHKTMKILLHSIVLVLTSASLALAGGEGWLTNWEAAKAKAKAENKPILINLTGSDWCTWCIKLEKEILSQKAFKDFAAENLVLMDADFPKKKEQSAELKKQNAALEKEYLAGGYPTVWLLDAEGKKLSTEDLGELKVSPEAFIAKLKELIAKAKK
jgi:thioredoxin-related protein